METVYCYEIDTNLKIVLDEYSVHFIHTHTHSYGDGVASEYEYGNIGVYVPMGCLDIQSRLKYWMVTCWLIMNESFNWTNIENQSIDLSMSFSKANFNKTKNAKFTLNTKDISSTLAVSFHSNKIICSLNVFGRNGGRKIRNPKTDTFCECFVYLISSFDGGVDYDGWKIEGASRISVECYF